MEIPFLKAVVMIATGAAVIKFALFEWEGIVQAWMRVTRLKRRRKTAGGRPR
jgi:hypothetical protein